MAVWNIVRYFKKTDRPLSTAKVFAGRQFEKLAAAYYRKLGFRLVGKNVWFAAGEIDLLFKLQKSDRYLLVEVRGRRNSDYPPNRFLASQKHRRLLRLATAVIKKYRRPVRVELCEMIGKPPHSVLRHLIAGWLARGKKMKRIRINRFVIE